MTVVPKSLKEEEYCPNCHWRSLSNLNVGDEKSESWLQRWWRAVEDLKSENILWAVWMIEHFHPPVCSYQHQHGTWLKTFHKPLLHYFWWVFRHEDRSPLGWFTLFCVRDCLQSPPFLSCLYLAGTHGRKCACGGPTLGQGEEGRHQ